MAGDRYRPDTGGGALIPCSTSPASRLGGAAAPPGAALLVEDITERVALTRAARQAEKLAALGTTRAIRWGACAPREAGSRRESLRTG